MDHGITGKGTGRNKSLRRLPAYSMGCASGFYPLELPFCNHYDKKLFIIMNNLVPPSEKSTLRNTSPHAPTKGAYRPVTSSSVHIMWSGPADRISITSFES